MNPENRYFVYYETFFGDKIMAVIEEEKEDHFVLTNMDGLTITVKKEKVTIVPNQRLVMLELFDKLIKGYD